MPACPVAPQTLELDDEQAAPLIRGSYLAPERSRIRGDVDGVLLERSKRNDLKRTLVGGRQYHVGGRAVFVRPQPVQGGSRTSGRRARAQGSGTEALE